MHSCFLIVLLQKLLKSDKVFYLLLFDADEVDLYCFGEKVVKNIYLTYPRVRIMSVVKYWKISIENLNVHENGSDQITTPLIIRLHMCG